MNPVLAGRKNIAVFAALMAPLLLGARIPPGIRNPDPGVLAIERIAGGGIEISWWGKGTDLLQFSTNLSINCWTDILPKSRLAPGMNSYWRWNIVNIPKEEMTGPQKFFRVVR